ncbi:MAG: hypothetical protein AAFZ15_28460 [Bacteroidota bacterium]
MTKQTKFFFLLFLMGSFLIPFSCNNTQGGEGSKDATETTEEKEDLSPLNGNLKTLNVKVVRKVREDAVVDVDKCTAQNDSCYVESGTGDLVNIEFCLDNQTGATVSSVDVDFNINGTNLTKQLTDVQVGILPTRFSTASVNLSGGINTLTVKINSQNTVTLPHCTDGE